MRAISGLALLPHAVIVSGRWFDIVAMVLRQLFIYADPVHTVYMSDTVLKYVFFCSALFCYVATS